MHVYNIINRALTSGSNIEICIGLQLEPSFFQYSMSENISSIKPHLNYQELVQLLKQRGMIIHNEDYAIKKLTQINYYRLSGFWYLCKKLELDNNLQPVLCSNTNKPKRLELFEYNTSFNEVIKFYRFDKQLRLLILDAIERIEIYMRSIIAHEIGKYNSLAYTDTNFIAPIYLKDFYTKNNVLRNNWQEWSNKNLNQINKSQEDFIVWHKLNNKPIPIWAVVETWDFGLMSKYYSMLKAQYKNKIIKNLEFRETEVLIEWLQAINNLRNKCAHHSRVWNQYNNNPIKVLNNSYFNKLNLDKNATHRIYGLICIINFLLQKICPNNSWINEIVQLINTKPSLPNCNFISMGINSISGLDISIFKN